MKFVECNVNDVNNRRPYGHLYKFVKAFDDSGLDCAKVENYHHKSAKSCSDSLRETIRRYKLTTIDAITRKGDVFLIRKSKFNFSQ